jgi:archaellum biogenesis protein FlaJ (TadC family)
MGILSTIFGGGDVISKGMDLIDDFHTSDTEMIEAKTNAKTQLLQAYAPFKIAQRYLALMFSATFLLSFILVLGMTLAGKGDIDAVKSVLSEFYIGEIMLTIIVFYFGGGFAEGALNSKKSKG